MSENTTKKEVSAMKVKKNRSTAYPGCSLEKALEYCIKLEKAYGKTQFSRESAVQGIGFNSITGQSASMVAALVHFGLLDRLGNTYKIGELGEKIIYHTSEDDKKARIAEAAARPKLYATLLKDYAGRAIPDLLKNIVVTNHGINRNVAEFVVKTFKESIEFAGLYKNGVVVESIPVGTESTETEEDADSLPPPGIETSVETKQPRTSVSEIKSEVPAGMLSVALPCGIVLMYPQKLAFRFAVGEFGAQIQALNAAVGTDVIPVAPQTNAVLTD